MNYFASGLLNLFNAKMTSNYSKLEDDLLVNRLRENPLKESREGKDRFYLTKRGKDVREDYVRQICQKLTGLRCWSCRPSWLLSKAGRRLELDIYCPELSLAVEVDGEIHAKFVPFYHRTRERYEKMKRSDILKSEICRRRGVKLIRIPHTIPTMRLEEYIVRKLMEKGVL